MQVFVFVCVCVSVSVSMGFPLHGCLYKCVLACLCASLASIPRTHLAVTSMIVVYSFDILHLVLVVHQPLSVPVRSF